MIDLRGLASDPAFMSAAHDALGFALPTQPRTSAAWGDVRVLWLSVDQWLILSTRSKAHEILANLRTTLKGIHSLAVDVSDMRAVIRLEGEGCREILMKGTSLDLLSGEYTPGTCRRMRFAEIAALLHVVEEHGVRRLRLPLLRPLRMGLPLRHGERECEGQAVRGAGRACLMASSRRRPGSRFASNSCCPSAVDRQAAVPWRLMRRHGLHAGELRGIDLAARYPHAMRVAKHPAVYIIG